MKSNDNNKEKNIKKSILCMNIFGNEENFN
jgi:hypothetical protein